MQTGMDACKGSTDTPKGSTLGTGEMIKLGNGFRKKVQTIRNEDESKAKVGTSNASAWRVYQICTLDILHEKEIWHVLID